MSLTPAEKTVRIQSLKKSVGSVVNVRLLGRDQTMKWTQTDDALEINFDGVKTGANGYALEVSLAP